MVAELDNSDAPTELTPGMMVGDYRIEGFIGRGGMGVVYAATHPVIGKRAAVKVLLEDSCKDVSMIERFIDEARVVNKIGHPNIVDIFAFGKLPDGRQFLVMELLKGESLRARIGRRAFTPVETAEIVKPLARALHAAHEAGVVHRDLKPDNVFLVEVHGELPIVKLLDFGIAKLTNTDHRLAQTASGAVIGTPQYLSPEQAKSLAVDRRADIYALGGIMFEMLTQRPPFVGTSMLEVVSKHLCEPPLRASHFVANVPIELDDIILAMLSKEPDGRPTLATVQSVLDRVRNGVATAAPQPSNTQAWGAPNRTPPITVPPPAAHTLEGGPRVSQPLVETRDERPTRNERPPHKKLSPAVWIGAPLVIAAAVIVGIVVTREPDAAPTANEVKEEVVEPIKPPAPPPPPPVVVEQTPPEPPVKKAEVPKPPVKTVPSDKDKLMTPGRAGAAKEPAPHVDEDDQPLTREERRKRRRERLERQRQRREGTPGGLMEPGQR